MNQTLFALRILLLAFCCLGGFAIWYLFPDSDSPSSPWPYVLVAVLLGSLLILMDILLKGFSLRGLSALTFGLFVGLLAAHFITVSPLFDGGDEKVIYISRVAVFVAMTYLATVIALRGKDEFNLVIPYVRFEPQSVESPIVVADISCMVDGRVVKLAHARLIADSLFVPKFVVDALNGWSDSSIDEERHRGRRGLKTLEDLRALPHMDVRIYESELERKTSVEDKILFIVRSLKGRLLTASESMARMAKQQGVTCVDLRALQKALAQEAVVGAMLAIRLVKAGKEDGQAVGYLEDGSMVVVKGAADMIGRDVSAEVDSIIPTAGGRMVFANLLGESD